MFQQMRGRLRPLIGDLVLLSGLLFFDAGCGSGGRGAPGSAGATAFGGMGGVTGDASPGEGDRNGNEDGYGGTGDATGGASLGTRLSEEPAPLPAFEVVDDETYQSLLDAATSVEILRNELAATPSSRLVASAALLMAFAEANRFATPGQLLTYAKEVDDLLAGAYPSDPKLLRSGHFLPALRFSSERLAVSDLEGTNTNVGQRALELLQLDLNISSRSLRAVDFERAQAVDFANYSPFFDLAVALLLDQRASGIGHRGLAEAFATLAQLHDLNLTSADLETEYLEVFLALEGAPVDFAAYVSEQEAGFGTTKTHITDEVTTVRTRIGESLAELEGSLTEEPDFFAAAANASDPALANALLERAQEERRKRGQSRAVFAINTLLMKQSGSDSDIEFARQARDFTDAQLEAESSLSTAAGVVQVLGAVFFGGGLLNTGDKIGAVGAMLVAVSGVLGLVDTAPSAEDQIFDEILALRQQVEEMRVEMHARFDSIDSQLNTIFEAISLGFNHLNETTQRIDGNVQQLSIDLYRVRSALSGLEANLYGVLSAGFEQSFVEDMETGLGHRARTGADLAYIGQGENNFFAFHSRFYTRATSSAVDEVYAGPASMTLTNDSSAAEVLRNFPLGYNINNLREFPTQLGLPVLNFSRVANPTTWALAADAYAQLARENPWYFAKLHQNEPSRLSNVIATGEATQRMMERMRDRDLIEALVNQYIDRVEALAHEVSLEDYLVANGHPRLLNPFVTSGWNMQDQGPPLETIKNFPHDDVPMWFDPSLIWELFLPEIGLAAAAKLPGWTLDRWVPVYNLFCKFYGSEAPPSCDLSFGLSDTTIVGGVNSAIVEFSFLGDTSDQLTTGEQIHDWLKENASIVAEMARAPMENMEFSAGGRTIVVAGKSTTEPYSPPIEDVVDQLNLVADEYWTYARDKLSSSTVLELFDSMTASQRLLEAYVALGLPETLEQNDLVRAVLRGAANQESGLGGEWLHAAFDTALIAGTRPPRFRERLIARANALLEQLAPGLDKPDSEVHPYLEWSLESLRAIEAKAFSLCNGDYYVMRADTQLVIEAERGVLANDAQQPGASSMSVTLVSPPSNGMMTLNADGSFEYEPDEGFVGTDSFSYSATADLNQTGHAPNEVTSLPQTVLIAIDS